MSEQFRNPPQVSNARLGSYPNVAPRSLEEAVSFLLGTAPTRDDELVLRYAVDAILNFSGCNCAKANSYTTVTSSTAKVFNMSSPHSFTSSPAAIGTITTNVAPTPPTPPADGGNKDKVRTSEKITIEVIEDAPSNTKEVKPRRKRSNG